MAAEGNEATEDAPTGEVDQEEICREEAVQTESFKGLGAEMWKQVGGVNAIERERESWV
jgi:hypothetical protein